MPPRPVTITYLQMFSPPVQPDLPLPEPITVMRSRQPTPSFYRFLYAAVGAGWHWLDRRNWSDEQLRVVLHRPEVEVWVLYYAGTPAGYSELVWVDQEVNVSYFGLMPEFVGKGLGRLWLGWTLHQAWRKSPRRVWLHTCDLDHPAALPLYQKLGLQAYDELVEMRDVPEGP
jgi:GNAT superfamily N-acetyltransferase